jgi:hypothetical protein
MAVAAYVMFLALSNEPSSVAGRRYTFNGATLQSAQKQLAKNPECPACGVSSTVGESTDDPWAVELMCGNSAQVVPREDLRLDLAAIARRYGPAVDVSNWYLRFQLGMQEAFLWRNGRLVVTNTSDVGQVKQLFRELTGRGEAR